MKPRLIFTFYRRYIVLASIVTLVVAVKMADDPFALPLLIKIWLAASFVAITHFTHAHEYTYYRNLGVRPAPLWTGSFAMDVVIFLGAAIPLRMILWATPSK